MDKFNKWLAAWEPTVLSIFRIMTGLLLFQFGVAKLLKFPLVPMFEKVQPLSLFGFAGMFELVFGALLILGLFSRLAAFILCGEMAFAYFIEHVRVSFFPLLNDGNDTVLFCFIFLFLAAGGGGPFSLDALLKQDKRT